MTPLQELNSLYEAIPDGYKKLPSREHGCSFSYFKNIVNGDVNNDEAIRSATESVRRAAMKIKVQLQEQIKQIEVIYEQL